MTTEERIAQLEAALTLERAKVHELSTALAAAVASDAHVKRVTADRKAARAVQNRAAYERRKQSQQQIQRAESGAELRAEPPAPPPPFPSSFPPSPAPSSPYPLSFPPSSPPPSASQEPEVPERPELVLEAKAPKPKVRKQAAEKPTDPRHAPLVKALTNAGWPFDGGKDGAHVKALLALSDQQEATRGELAGLEVLRRAQIAWSQFPGFHSARTLSGLRSKWGEFSTPDMGRGQGAPDVRRGSVRAELIDHTKPEEPF